MTHIKLFIQLVALVLGSLSIDACRNDSDCSSVSGGLPVQCCNGECIDKYVKCPLWTLDTIVGLVLAFGTLVFGIFVTCLCCPCCPGYRYRPRSRKTIIILAQNPYQQLTDQTTFARNMASSSPGVGVCYPQPPSTQQLPIRHPMELEDDLEEESAAFNIPTETQPFVSSP